ncbi:MAG: excinuclease ABC subunit UvrC [Candidatus Gastranaerophilales bacterium]|nr:excinuclease ABC subunit UvrC [Candidatus Gastranaerophilales bacterium]
MKTKISIKNALKLLPECSGVYLMYDNQKTIIYIGKAKNLKKRVNSYFSKNHDSPKLQIMVPQIEKFEFIITDSEIEALILESHLIKKHKPKYNVLLKDDKKFPWFLITDEDYPRIIITRKADKKEQKGKYFGPYTNARAMYSTLELIKKLFPLKQCKTPKFKDRPCIYYQMNKCLAPCRQKVSSDEYKKVVKQVELFLSGKQTELIAELKRQMEKYAQNQEYEKAAKYRDSYFDIQQTLEKQKVVSENTNVNQDIIGFDNDNTRICIALLKVRDGRLIAKEDFEILLNNIHTIKEALAGFLREYYQMLDSQDIPKEILLQDEIENEDLIILSKWLNLKKSSKVSILIPKLQKKHELVELAIKNASYYLETKKIEDSVKIQSDWNIVGSYIQEKLSLDKFPHRVECYDISHIQGTNTVASMVVFINGKSCKSEYRRYKIHSIKNGKPDDFASMQEVIKRRFIRILKNNDNMPDLIIVDGGKGQLSSAKEVLDELGLFDQPIISLAKKLEEVFVPEKSEPTIFTANSNALFFFQQIRDEAHRFAITYHRKLRENQATKSILDEIPGLSVSKKKILFEHFENIKGILNANRAELERVLGKAIGYKVFKHLHQ